MRMLKGISIRNLKDIKIVSEKCGSDLTPKCGSYGAHTLFSDEGTEYVLWTSMGELNLSKVVETK